MKRSILALLAGTLLATGAFAANDHAAHHDKPATSAAASPAGDLVDGEVRKVDKEAGKVTLKHGPLTNLDMPAMTMVFRVKDAAMLERLKTGDSIRFKADKIDGAYTVVQIEGAK